MPSKNNTIEQKQRVHLGIRKKICPSTILMLKADVNYTKVFMQDGASYLSSVTLGVLEQRLSGFNFFRLNRSIMINLTYVEDFSISADKIGMVRLKENNQEFVVSRRRKPQLIKALITDTNYPEKY